MPPRPNADIIDWLKHLFDTPPPAETPPYVPPASTGKTPEENAKALVERYLKWAGAGGKTGPVKDEGGNPVLDSKHEATYQPVDPETGKVDPDFPTEQQFDAARQFLASKAGSGPAVISAPPTEKFIVRSDGTVAENPNFKGPQPAATAQPGEGVYNPSTGKYDVPVPKPVTPGKTQAQIDQEAQDAHDKARLEVANSETPQQKQARELARITATANAEGDAKIREWQTKVNAGYVMKPEDEAKLKADLDEIASQHNAERAQALEQFKYDLNEPNKNRELGVMEQNATTNAAQAENNRVNQETQNELTRRGQEGEAYKQQAAAGQANLDTIIKAGSATPMSAASLRAVTGPLEAFWQLAHQQVNSGQLHPAALPTPQAPQPVAQPAGPPQAPLPAGVAASDPNYPGPK